MADTDAARLLDEAERVLHGIAIDLIAHKHLLDKPFTDYPSLSPWTRTTGKLAHLAHDLARDIRKHLGLAYRHGSSGLGTPPLTSADVEEAIRAEEREACALLAEREAARLYGAGCGADIAALQDFAGLIRARTTPPQEGTT